MGVGREVGHHQVYRDQQNRAEHHKERALSDAINEQAEQRCSEHGEEGKDADQESPDFAGGVMGLDKELNGESFKGKDGGVKNDAQRDNVPVRDAEVGDVLEDYFVG